MSALSDTMKETLAKIGKDWGKLPPNTGITSLTLKALKKRGLIETRGINADRGFYRDFQVRLTPETSP